MNNSKNSCKNNTIIFCDMDDVLVDFNTGFFNLFGCQPYELERAEMWRLAATVDNFYFSLPPMNDYLELWDAIKHLNPGILTAIPRKGKIPNAESDKQQWRTAYLGAHVPFRIGPYAHEKKNHCTKGAVLIDDREENINDWIEAGGIGILHTSAKDTIQQLKSLNII